MLVDLIHVTVGAAMALSGVVITALCARASISDRRAFAAEKENERLKGELASSSGRLELAEAECERLSGEKFSGCMTESRQAREAPSLTHDYTVSRVLGSWRIVNRPASFKLYAPVIDKAIRFNYDEGADRWADDGGVVLDPFTCRLCGVQFDPHTGHLCMEGGA